ncbi:YchJ family protein [Actinomadura parmotrematis]|uniref:UPF0225 protein K1Y72_16350 n=1 Tax=Actinomadura parmotrematis TaxID=2864039 RepID=A0ABS7FU78_9ACTN|nr:YchJ family metal-binding protein [Actinomadura parmotrematis]MBW8483959.1 hypothetical protein [Actinomadura parmotrematis]
MAKTRMCPCGLPAAYDDCCGRLHRGEAKAATAEQLMRSRYSAFAVGDSRYLLETWHPATRPVSVDLNRRTVWEGLEIVRTVDGTAFNQAGTVEFRARYRGGELHEVSRFARVGGAWVYVDGDS